MVIALGIIYVKKNLKKKNSVKYLFNYNSIVFSL